MYSTFNMDSFRPDTQQILWVVLTVAIILVALYRILSRPKTISRPFEKASEDWSTLDFTNVEPIAADFDWSTTREVPYRPWHDAPHHVTMGIQRTSLDDWVHIDKTYLSKQRYKNFLFAQHPHDTLQGLPGSEAPSFEALHYLVDFLPRRYPTMFRRLKHGIANLVTEETWEDLREGSKIWKTHHPLQVMGLLTTEDWLIMRTDPDGCTTRLAAAANCFPAGWKLRERIGLSLWQIHAGKVPLYEEKLSRSMDRFFLRLRADTPYMRFNYAIDNDPELFHIHSHHNLDPTQLDKPLTMDQLYLRVERQFLQRLPKSRAILFSIRTYITPLSEVTRDLAVARALRTSVNSYSDLVSSYKNKPLWNETLAKHFETILGPGKDDEEETGMKGK